MAENNQKTKAPLDLTDKNLLQAIKEELGDVVVEDDFDRARKMAKNLSTLLQDYQNFESEHPDLYSAYIEIIKIAKWISLHVYTQKEIISMIEEDVATAIKDPDIILWDKIRTFLLSSVLLKDRDAVKRMIREALLRNSQTLTKTKIDNDGTSETGTVGNWLKEYNRKLGARPLQQRSVELYNYLNSDPNLKRVTSEEKQVLIKLFDFYERLKHSSLSLAGFEGSLGVEDEANNRYGIISEGDVIALDKKSMDRIKRAEIIREVALGLRPNEDLNQVMQASYDEEQDTVEKQEAGIALPAPETGAEQISPEEQEILDAYKGDPRQVKAVTKEARKILSKFGSDVPRLRAEFFSAVQKKNVVRVIALLRIMAQKQELENFISNDQKLNKFLTNIWQKQYGDEFIKEFSQKPDQLKFTKIFLRYILEQRLGLSSNDAARIGLQIANVFVSSGKKSYNKMAYFDVKTKTFNWLD